MKPPVLRSALVLVAVSPFVAAACNVVKKDEPAAEKTGATASATASVAPATAATDTAAATGTTAPLAAPAGSGAAPGARPSGDGGKAAAGDAGTDGGKPPPGLAVPAFPS